MRGRSVTRKVTQVGLGLVAALVLSSVATAQAATTYSTTATGTPGGGSKKAPAPFGGSWVLKGDAGGPDVRPALPVSWSWAWEGVVVNSKGFKTCTAAQIDAAQSDSVCPKGSQVGTTSANLVARFGPENDPLTNAICLGKGFTFYNAGPKQATLFIEGPPDQCGGVDYLAPTTVDLATKGNSTTMTINWPENISKPLPGLKSGLSTGGLLFPVTKTTVKKGKKKVKSSYLQSVGCSGTREFTFTAVDDEKGATTIKTSTGKCKSKKPSKQKKG